MADLVLAVLRGLRPVEVCLFVCSCVLQARLVAPAHDKPAPPPGRPDNQSAPPANADGGAGAHAAEAAPAGAGDGGAKDEPHPPRTGTGLPPPPSPPPLLALAAPVMGVTRALVSSVPLAQPLVAALGDAVTRAALAPITGALAAAHVVLEGARWQLFGLYAATAGAALCHAALPGGVPRTVAAVACACCTAVTACATWAFPWFVLPKPTGPFRVGRMTRVWVDDTRGAWVTPDKGAPRRLLVDIWYPASHDGGRKVVTYMDRVLASAMSVAFLGPRAWFVASHFSLVPTSSRRDAPGAALPAHLPRGFPVVLFSHGNVSTRVQNTSLMEDLASHGYICVSPDHPHDAAVVAYPDGTQTEFEWDLPEPLDAAGVLAFRAAQVDLRAGDLAFCLQQLTDMGLRDVAGPLYGRVDSRRVCVMGHSFGGATAAVAARQMHANAAVLLDAWQWPLGRGSSHLGGELGDVGHGDDDGDAPAAAPSHCPSVPMPCPTLLFESDAFLGDRDAFCAFNGRMSSAQALASPQCWKIVAHVGHYEYADMSFTAPHFMRASGLLALRAEQLRPFHAYQGRLVRSFLEAHVLGKGAQDDKARVIPADGRHDDVQQQQQQQQQQQYTSWSPPESRFAILCTPAMLAADVAGQGYTPRQRAAMRLLYLQLRRGDYEIWGVRRELDPSHELPAAIVPVIHTHGYRSLRRIMMEIAAEEEAAEAQRARRKKT